jgi:hypothetical protein
MVTDEQATIFSNLCTHFQKGKNTFNTEITYLHVILPDQSLRINPTSIKISLAQNPTYWIYTTKDLTYLYRCEIQGSHSSADKNSYLLECYVM